MLREAWGIHGGHFLPQRYMDISDEITRQYPNLYLVWVEPENRPEGDIHPFGIAMEGTNGAPDTLVKFLTEAEMSAEYVINWLRQNDATDEDKNHFENFLNDLIKQQEDIQKKRQEDTAEQVDLLASIATSNLHTYRHNGLKIGAENSRPSIYNAEQEAKDLLDSGALDAN